MGPDMTYQGLPPTSTSPVWLQVLSGFTFLGSTAISSQTRHPPKITKYRSNIWQLPQDILTIT